MYLSLRMHWATSLRGAKGLTLLVDNYVVLLVTGGPNMSTLRTIHHELTLACIGFLGGGEAWSSPEGDGAARLERKEKKGNRMCKAHPAVLLVIVVVSHWTVIVTTSPSNTSTATVRFHLNKVNVEIWKNENAASTSSHHHIYKHKLLLTGYPAMVRGSGELTALTAISWPRRVSGKLTKA